jgi:hypothetical protein
MKEHKDHPLGIVLKHSTDQPFPATALSVSHSNSIQWNLCAFDTPSRPSHAAAAAATKHQQRRPEQSSPDKHECTWVFLRFDDAPAQDKFRLKLLETLKGSRDQRAAFRGARGDIFTKAERPGRVVYAEERRGGGGSRAPRLPVQEQFESFSDSRTMRGYYATTMDSP